MMLLPQLVNAFDELQLTVDSPEVELGQPLYISITARNIKTNLSTININELRNDFGVKVIETANKSENSTITQELKIELYPLQTGQLVIPPVMLERYSTKPVRVNIKPARVINGKIEFSSSVNHTSVWQRQQVILSTTVITPSKFAKLELDDFITRQAITQKLTPTQEALDNGKYKLTSGWVIYPINDGEQTYTTPAVNYRLSGTIQRKFYPQNISIQVKKLPSYVPPLMPVGKFTLNSMISENTAPGASSHIRSIQASSNSVLPETLKAISIPYINNSSITSGEMTRSSNLENKHGSFNITVSHHTPISFTNSGIHYLPGFGLRYFDPVTGRIETINIGIERILFIKPWLKLVTLILFLIVFFLLSRIIIKHINRYVRRQKYNYHLIQATLIAKSPEELHKILNQYAGNNQWGMNMTLTHWLKAWNNHRTEPAENIINELSDAIYANRMVNNPSQLELNKKIYTLLNT